MKFKSRIKNITDRGEVAVAISIDIANAFNSISWDVINKEMENKEFPPYIRAKCAAILMTGLYRSSPIEMLLKGETSRVGSHRVAG